MQTGQYLSGEGKKKTNPNESGLRVSLTWLDKEEWYVHNHHQQLQIIDALFDALKRQNKVENIIILFWESVYLRSSGPLSRRSLNEQGQI